MSLLLWSALLVLQAETAGKDLPLQVPEGWESRRQDGVRMVLPKQVEEGKIYTVLVPGMTRKLGTLRLVLDAARETLGEVGKFSPATDPVRGKTDGLWEYEFVIGTLEKDGRTFMAQATGLRKEGEEAVLLVLADSIETMLKYGDGLGAMIRSVGAPKVAPAAGAGVATSAKDLKVVMPAGWMATDQDGAVLLEKWENKGSTYGTERNLRLVILPSRPVQENLRKTFLAAWTEQIKPILETTIAPLPMLRRLKSGLAVAYDVDDRAKNLKGGPLVGGLYLLSQGKLVVPIVSLANGFSSGLEADLVALFESAEISGAGAGQAALYDAADLAGRWDKSSCSLASFVTAGGAFAGDASVSIDETFTFNGDESYTYEFTGLGRTAMHTKHQGQWKLDDMALVLTEKKPERYRLFGTGSDPKAGRFLVMSIAADTTEQLDLTHPRRMLSGSWFKKKE
jgi:hypothetical protein